MEGMRRILLTFYGSNLILNDLTSVTLFIIWNYFNY